MSVFEESPLTCPYCGEIIIVLVDPGGGAAQEYIEDCQVCCQPIEIRVVLSAEGIEQISADREGD